MDKLYLNPSMDPANNNNLTGSVVFAFSKLMQQMDKMLPARVIKYDREKNRVHVQILIRLVLTDGSSRPRNQIAELPVLQLGGGGFFLNFALNTGDLGWILANDRDISNFLKSYDESVPNTYRLNSFSDALFIPDIMTDYDIAEESTDGLSIQSKDGTTAVILSENGIIIKSNKTVTVDAQEDVNINTSGNTIVSVASGAGVFAVDGNITASGTITEGVPPPI